MNTVKVRNLELGGGIPAVCIPNVGKTKEEILTLTEQYKSMPMDLMEWRVDWFEGVEDTQAVLDVLSGIREKEGGVHDIDTAAYIALNKAVAATKLADLIDVEIFTGDEIVSELIHAIHASGTKVVASNHDFDRTPAKSDIVYRLRKMQDMGADIPKIAVMPRSKRDVLTLLSATEEMASDYADRPIITMSMAGLGSISRLSCEVFGSCLTFGSGSMASAPGQIGAQELKEVLTSVHNALGN